MQRENITNYEFFQAVNGKELEPTNELYYLFERNDFNYKKGVIGCTLSHLYLWKQLIEDKHNDFYELNDEDIFNIY